MKRYLIGAGPDDGWIYDTHQKTEVAHVCDKTCWPMVEDANAAYDLRTELELLQAQITDLHAMAESNQATIARLLAENAQLRALADTQAAIIAAKNAEIAEMRGDYAGALVNDAELTGDVLAASQGAQ